MSWRGTISCDWGLNTSHRGLYTVHGALVQTTECRESGAMMKGGGRLQRLDASHRGLFTVHGALEQTTECREAGAMMKGEGRLQRGSYTSVE